ncbi:MAG: hypothetical protein SPE19_12430 [Candidatus Faecousia sp.]|nr:hypothetical protein [Candidatus Faecousia sp.]
MNLKKRWKADREALKKLSGQEKWLFIWDYYRIPLIALGCVMILTAITLLTNAGREEVALYAVFVNSDRTLEEPDSTPLDALAERAGIPMEGRTVDVTANLTLGQDLNEAYDAQTVQMLAALFGISDLDLFAADEEVFEGYAQQDAFADLSVLIDRELLAGADLYTYTLEGKTVTGGIVLHSGSALHEAGYYHGDVIVGAAVNAEHLEEAVAVLRQLLVEAQNG